MPPAKTVEDFAKIADQAAAVKYMAKKVGLAADIAREAAEVRLLAERSAGELLAKMMNHKGGRPTKNRCSVQQFSLDDLGLERTKAHRWQRVASVPQAAFDAYLADSAEPTTAGASLIEWLAMP